MSSGNSLGILSNSELTSIDMPIEMLLQEGSFPLDESLVFLTMKELFLMSIIIPKYLREKALIIGFQMSAITKEQGNSRRSFW